LWNRRDLLGDPWGPPPLGPGSVPAARAVRDVAARVAAALGVPADLPMPAYDDVLHGLWT
jgi:uncharacterized protein (DUF2126 family)